LQHDPPKLGYRLRNSGQDMFRVAQFLRIVYMLVSITAIPNLRFHDIKILMTRGLYNS